MSIQKDSTRVAGLLFNKYFLIAMIILIILAAWGGQVILVILLGLILGVAGLSLLWSHWSLKAVTCERQLTTMRVFPGEHLELTLRLTNRKIIPLPWVEVCDEVPSGFLGEMSQNLLGRPGYELISKSTSILWYSTINWKYRLFCSRRGYYKLGPLSVTSGDIFGFYPRTSYQALVDYIIVYPKIYSISRFTVSSNYPQGDSKSEKRIFQDPSRMIGIRDYVPGDPLRRIHWKASARQQKLQVKLFEATTTLKAALFLVVDSFREIGAMRLKELELGISTAGSIATYFIENKNHVGLWVNTQLADSNQPARIAPGAGVEKLVQILETLAKVVPAENMPFVQYFEKERQSLSTGLTLIFIMAEISSRMVGVLEDLKTSGYKMMVFIIGKVSADTGISLDVPIYNIKEADEIGELGKFE
jgi:uncharacterized protein (DUF58 family)